MAEQEDPHLLSWTSPNYNNIQKKGFFLVSSTKKTRTHQKRSSTMKDIKKEAERLINGVEMQYGQDPNPHVNDGQWEEHHNRRGPHQGGRGPCSIKGSSV